jgi:hypothetical protein
MDESALQKEKKKEERKPLSFTVSSRDQLTPAVLFVDV